MITDRKREGEYTGFQESAPYSDSFAIGSDFVMVYGLGNDMPGRIREYRRHGYIVHLMTGVSWGSYTDYLDGEFDGLSHRDEAQKDRKGETVNHGVNSPYMIPTDAFADYLTARIKPAIDEGVFDIHMEEPEIWAFSGYSDAIKREYEMFYHEKWTPPHESADAYYKTAQLKQHLFTRVIERVAHALKEYAMVKYGRCLSFYVPTHSLINYVQYGIVSPESALMDAPSVDGYIAQIWTDTSRVPTVYRGVFAERIFESAFLEYGIMQELVRGTGRKMWLLQDPIEDKPDESWDYYRKSYLKGLTAALLQPEIHNYEICPWPRRVWGGTYPKGENGIPLPKDYETTLLSIGQALRDMDQPYRTIGEDTAVGVLIADSSMFQRNHPDGPALTGEYAERGHEFNFSGFFGLAMPLIRKGIRVLPVQLDNITRFADYLKPYHLLVLSYEFMKPCKPEINLSLALWTRMGGTLLIVSDGSDDFHNIGQWWTKSGYPTPLKHLYEALGISGENGVFACGHGTAAVMNLHPAAIAYRPECCDEYLALIRELMLRCGMSCTEKNFFALRRGPYLIAQVLEDAAGETFDAEGRFVNLFSPTLEVLNGIHLQPGENILAADLSAYSPDFCLVGSAGRVDGYEYDGKQAHFTVRGPEGSHCVLRFKSPRPSDVRGAGSSYDEDSGTLLLTLSGKADGTEVYITL